jgi:multidrug efflux pump subunit AcrA (membrane-fusion protein)
MSGGVEKWKSSKKVLVGAAILIVGGLVFGAFRLANSAVNLPTTEVKRKEFVDYLEIKGEIKAIRSAVIAAPYSAGDLQILKLVANATKVKKGDVLVEFDATTVRQKLAEDQSAV